MATKRTVLVLLLSLLGCGSPERPSLGGDTGVASVGPEADAAAGSGSSGGGGHTGGASGRGDAGATGGSGGTGGTGALPARTDAAADGVLAMSTLDAAPGGDTWAKCGPESFKPGISAADFCAKYMSACKFDPAGDGKERYKSVDDCVAKYNMLSDGPRGGKACVAYHLCVAASPDTAETFCPHAPEASAMTGPCKAAYL
jgi:hypothetical protein